MATTTHHQPPTNKYILIVSGSTGEFFLQNTSKSAKASCMLIWATSVPAADEQGHVLKVGEAVIRNSLTGMVYARAMTTDCTLTATVEPDA